MITFKIDVPDDLGEILRKHLEKSLATHLQREGLADVTVTIDAGGQARFEGPESSLQKVESALQRWR